MAETMTYDDIVKVVKEKQEPTWKHFFPKLWSYIKIPFVNPNAKPKSKELDVSEYLPDLLKVGTQNEASAQICKEYIRMHRVMENTKARRRLENWTKRIIGIYLFVVLIIVLLATIPYGEAETVACCADQATKHIINIDTTLLVAILSTTTVNILGLAFIVLRGYFPQLEKEEDE